ncbi:CRACD-like protein isoform X2 [Polypterus senegalus]|uniref:CRACD-like protein isoform X2 n=1 Tax=Polypterus senegalus TaxID=55291 RepID=UPI001962D6D7|nr:CRACD-like protein isoform X2 [Polypterus senegalus]
MDSRMEETEGSHDDATGKKKSKFISFKIRLFGRRKRKEDGHSSSKSGLKQSQSASDVTAPEPIQGLYDSEEELECPKGVLGSRALSHDSIFIPETTQELSAPARVLSQENVSAKIKALQMKLQTIRFGPPPLVISAKRAEDTGASSEDDGLPRSPPEISPFQESLAHGTMMRFTDTCRHLSSLSLAGTGSEDDEQLSSQPSSRPLSPISKSHSRPSTPVSPSHQTSDRYTSPAVDFSSPPQSSACLDNSAARHRLSVKPRNQRAAAKGRRLPTNPHRPRSESLNELDLNLLEKEEDDEKEISQEIVRCNSYSCQVPRTESLTALIPKWSPFEQVSDTLTEKSTEQVEDWDVKTSAAFVFNQSSQLLKRKDSIPNNALCSDYQESCSTSDLNRTAEAHKSEASLTKLEMSPLKVTGLRKGLLEELLKSDAQATMVANTAESSSSPLKSVARDASSKTNNMARNALDQGRTTQSTSDSKELPSTVSRTINSLPLKISSKGSNQPYPEKDHANVLSDNSKKNFEQILSARNNTMSLPRDINTEKAKQSPQSPFEKKNGGSFRCFSISSAWDRPRACSFTAVESLERKIDKIGFVKTTFHSGQYSIRKKEESKREKEVSVLDSEIKTCTKEAEQNLTAAEVTQDRQLPNLSMSPVAKPSGITTESGGTIPYEGEEEEKSPFGIKLRSTSLSLRYRGEARSEFKVKRYSAEVCTMVDKEDNIIGKEGKEDSLEAKGSPQKDAARIKVKPSEQLHAKPPLPRKPPLENIESTNSTPKNERKNWEKVTTYPKSTEKGTPSKSLPEMSKESDVLLEPEWINMAKMKQRGFHEKDTLPDNKMDKMKKSDLKETAKPASDVWISRTPPTIHSTVQGNKQDQNDIKPEQKPFSSKSPVPHTAGSPIPCHQMSPEKQEKGHQQPACKPAQPSWMELAKKKSQAWSDKSMD